MRYPTRFLMVSTVFIILLSSCGSSPTTPKVLSQESQDSYIAWGIADTFWFIWNQYIWGSPAGPKDFEVPGPSGGTVHVYGSNSVGGSGVNSVDLTFDMTQCRSITVDTDLTFTGSLICTGNFSSYATAMTYVSSSLSYWGVVDREETNTNVSEVGPVSISDDGSGLSGTICGRPFAY